MTPPADRRSYDPLLQEVRDDIRDVKQMLTDLVIARSDQAGRLTRLETWQEKIVDPFIANARDLGAQARGAGRLINWVRGVLLVIGGGAAYKVIAALLVGVSKAP